MSSVDPVFMSDDQIKSLIYFDKSMGGALKRKFGYLEHG
jgi:hypothetical protein